MHEQTDPPVPDHDWSSYNAALKRRGSLMIWLDPEMSWFSAPSGKPGHPARFTTLYVTHDQREALTIADRIAVMDHGRIVQIDTPETIYRHPECEFVARFIGEAAILPVAALAPAALAQELAAGQPRVVIRSEDFCLAPPAGGQVLSVSGRLRNTVFQGDSWLLRVVLGDGASIDVRAQRQYATEVAALDIGAEIKLFLPAERLHFLADAA